MYPGVTTKQLILIGPSNTTSHSQVNVVTPVGRQMSVFNSQSRIQLGGKWHQVVGRVEKPYLGVMAGLVYNKVRVLDQVKERKPGTDIMGHVNLLDTVPYNYRKLNMDKFERMQRTETSNSPGVEDDIIVRVGGACPPSSGPGQLGAECFKYSGDGDELITPVYLAPTRPKQREQQATTQGQERWPGPCQDDEDCPDDPLEGSGGWQRVSSSSTPSESISVIFVKNMTQYKHITEIFQGNVSQRILFKLFSVERHFDYVLIFNFFLISSHPLYVGHSSAGLNLNHFYLQRRIPISVLDIRTPSDTTDSPADQNILNNHNGSLFQTFVENTNQEPPLQPLLNPFIPIVMGITLS